MPERIDLTEAPLPRAPRAKKTSNERGTGNSKLDGFATKLLGISALAAGLFLLYLLWGLLSGAWSHEFMGLLPHAARAQQMENIALVFRLLQSASFFLILSLLVSCARAEGVGYWLLGGAAFFSVGTSFLTEQVYGFTHHTASSASQLVLTDFGTLAWMFGVPGVLWTMVDIGRRLAAAADIAAVQRANAKYGHGVQKQKASTQRQVFLGRCWKARSAKTISARNARFLLKRKAPAGGARKAACARSALSCKP